MQLDPSELAAVAMFPLPDVVLLPGSLMPLHIFEPRYREMTRDVLAGSGLIALARLQEGYESDYHGRPPVHPTVGVGRVIAADQLADGRYNLLVRGLIRGQLAEELPLHRMYRLIRVRALPDEPGEVAVARIAQQKLIALCDELAEAMEQGGEQLRELIRSAPTPGGCADIAAAALVTDVDQRQALLEATEPIARLERMIVRVSRMLTELGSRDADLLN